VRELTNIRDKQQEMITMIIACYASYNNKKLEMWANAQRTGPPYWIQVAPTVQRRNLADARY